MKNLGIAASLPLLLFFSIGTIPSVSAQQGVTSFSATQFTPSELGNRQFSGEVTNTGLVRQVVVKPLYQNGVLRGVEARLNGAVFQSGVSTFSGSANFPNSTFTGSTSVPQGNQFSVTGDPNMGLILRSFPGVGGLE